MPAALADLGDDLPPSFFEVVHQTGEADREAVFDAYARAGIAATVLAVACIVGPQMSWTLRPFVGYPGANFELIREFGGNFYTNILYSIGEILGFLVVM